VTYYFLRDLLNSFDSTGPV